MQNKNLIVFLILFIFLTLWGCGNSKLYLLPTGEKYIIGITRKRMSAVRCGILFLNENLTIIVALTDYLQK